MEVKNTEENLKSKQQCLKVGSRVKLLKSGYLTMHEGEIVRENPFGIWVVRMDDGKTIEVPKWKVITANAAPVSKNAIVQNALAWKAGEAVAKNCGVALNFGEFHVGARIKDGERKGTIIKQYGFNDLMIDVKFDDGEIKRGINVLRPEVRPLNSAAADEGVAKNADADPRFWIELSIVVERDANNVKESVEHYKKEIKGKVDYAISRAENLKSAFSKNPEVLKLPGVKAAYDKALKAVEQVKQIRL